MYSYPSVIAVDVIVVVNPSSVMSLNSSTPESFNVDICIRTLSVFSVPSAFIIVLSTKYLSVTVNLTVSVFASISISGFSAPSTDEYWYLITGFMKSTMSFLNASYLG